MKAVSFFLVSILVQEIIFTECGKKPSLALPRSLQGINNNISENNNKENGQNNVVFGIFLTVVSRGRLIETN